MLPYPHINLKRRPRLKICRFVPSWLPKNICYCFTAEASFLMPVPHEHLKSQVLFFFLSSFDRIQSPFFSFLFQKINKSHFLPSHYFTIIQEAWLGDMSELHKSLALKQVMQHKTLAGFLILTEL